MWWRFLIFCVLVTLILFVVLSSIHGRPVIHQFFHRCCDEDIENGHIVFANFGDNIPKERLIAINIFEVGDENRTSNEVENLLNVKTSNELKTEHIKSSDVDDTSVTGEINRNRINTLFNVHDLKSRTELSIGYTGSRNIENETSESDKINNNIMETQTNVHDPKTRIELYTEYEEANETNDTIEDLEETLSNNANTESSVEMNVLKTTKPSFLELTEDTMLPSTNVGELSTGKTNSNLRDANVKKFRDTSDILVNPTPKGIIK